MVIFTQKHHYSCGRNATIYVLPSIIAFNILFMDFVHLKEPPVSSLVIKLSHGQFSPTCYVYYNFNEKFFHAFEECRIGVTIFRYYLCRDLGCWKTKAHKLWLCREYKQIKSYTEL